MNITTIGIDLAKNVFQVHAVDERGHVIIRKQLKREQMASFFANLPPTLIGKPVEQRITGLVSFSHSGMSCV